MREISKEVDQLSSLRPIEKNTANKVGGRLKDVGGIKVQLTMYSELIRANMRASSKAVEGELTRYIDSYVQEADKIVEKIDRQFHLLYNGSI
jgi:hypothetical protein